MPPPQPQPSTAYQRATWDADSAPACTFTAADICASIAMALSSRRKLVALQRDQLELIDRPGPSDTDAHTGLTSTRHIRGPRRGKRCRSARLLLASMSAAQSQPEPSKEWHREQRRRRSKHGSEIFLVASSEPSTSQTPAWRTVLGNVAAGATAGATVEAALYPIDTIKTRLQATISGGGLRALLQGGGGRALYAGLLGNLAGVVPASAIFMGIYEPVKRHIADRVSERRGYLAPLGGGALAGLAASVVRVPTEVVKQRLQTGEFSGALRAISSITKVEGARGLFAGYGSFLLRDLPFDAIEFVAYEQLKKTYKAGLTEARDPNSLETSAIGAIAGAFTGVVTTPLDVIKTRLMTQGSARTYTGVLDCAQKIWKLEGSSAFLKGWQPRVIWIGLGGCVFFTALEEAKKLYLPKESGR